MICDRGKVSVSGSMAHDISAAFDTLDHHGQLSLAKDVFGISGNDVIG